MMFKNVHCHNVKVNDFNGLALARGLQYILKYEGKLKTERRKKMIGRSFKTKKEAIKVIHQLRKQGIKTNFYLQGLRYLVTYQAK